jgi:AcrR family transcriptional regulator
METPTKSPAEIRNAAFALAADRGWARLTLADIAFTAGISLAELQHAFPSKAAILESFGRDMDQALLALTAKDPVTGTPHDRLFDVILRRLEIMQPYKKALARILENPGLSPSEAARACMRAQETLGWMLAAADLDEPGLDGLVNRQGLGLVYARILHVWVKDEDAGLTRTMAALDRSLRDAALWRGRIQTPLALAKGFAALGASFFKQRQAS